MFFYDSFFNQALTALGTTALTSVQAVSYMILAITFLLSVYEAFARGGDTRQLMIGFLKYVVAAVAIQNWSTVFNDIHTGAESIAWAITSHDYVSLWQANYANFLQNNEGSAAAGIASLPANLISDGTRIIVAMLFGVAVYLFDFIYAIWGCILFCLAPLLIATMPSISLAGFGKKFLTGLAEWCMWPILYAVFAAMAFGMNSADVTAIAASKTFSDVVSGTSNVYLISIMSLVVGLCLLFIPFLAHFLIGASFDGAAATFVAMSKMTGGNVAALASAGGGGAGGGAGGGIGGGGGSAPGSGGGGGGSAPGDGGVAAAGRQPTGTDSTPPPATPSMDASGDMRKNLAAIGRI